MMRRNYLAAATGLSVILAASLWLFNQSNISTAPHVTTPDVRSGYPVVDRSIATEPYPGQLAMSESDVNKKVPYPGPNVDLKLPTPTPMLGEPDGERPGWRRYRSEAGDFALSFPENSIAIPSLGYWDRQELFVTVPADGAMPPLTVGVSSLPTHLANDALGRLVEMRFSTDVDSAQALLDHAERVDIGGQVGYLISMPERGMEPALLILGLPNRVLIAYRGSRSMLTGVAEDDDVQEQRWWKVISTLQAGLK